MKTRIAAIDGGTYYHQATLHDPLLREYFQQIIYAPELPGSSLEEVDVLFVASRQDPQLMIEAAPTIRAFLDAGKTVVALGESESERWLPGIEWHPREVNFWWWLTPGADSRLRIGDKTHPLWNHLSLADATWHQHGYFNPPPGARRLIDHADGGCILYEDTHSTAGRMILTTLDPCYHHGSYFMPSASRFLYSFLPWLAQQETPAENSRRPDTART